MIFFALWLLASGIQSQVLQSAITDCPSQRVRLTLPGNSLLNVVDSKNIQLVTYTEADDILYIFFSDESNKNWYISIRMIEGGDWQFLYKYQIGTGLWKVLYSHEYKRLVTVTGIWSNINVIRIYELADGKIKFLSEQRIDVVQSNAAMLEDTSIIPGQKNLTLIFYSLLGDIYVLKENVYNCKTIQRANAGQAA